MPHRLQGNTSLEKAHRVPRAQWTLGLDGFWEILGADSGPIPPRSETLAETGLTETTLSSTLD